MAGDDSVDMDGRVALAEIKGDVKLILAGQSRTNDDVKDLRDRVHLHSNRIGVLEADKHLRTGERQGLALSAKVLHWVTGGSVIAVVALIARHFGA